MSEELTPDQRAAAFHGMAMNRTYDVLALDLYERRIEMQAQVIKDQHSSIIQLETELAHTQESLRSGRDNLD